MGPGILGIDERGGPRRKEAILGHHSIRYDLKVDG
jgi:hypothetical protein